MSDGRSDSGRCLRIVYGHIHQHADAAHPLALLRARAGSGHAAAAPPSSVMNSRLFNRSPRRRAAEKQLEACWSWCVTFGANAAATNARPFAPQSKLRACLDELVGFFGRPFRGFARSGTPTRQAMGPISSIMGVPSTSQASIPSLGARLHRDTAAIAIVNSCLE